MRDHDDDHDQCDDRVPSRHELHLLDGFHARRKAELEREQQGDTSETQTQASPDHEPEQNLLTGIEFLENVKLNYPRIIRIILTGYSDINAITESINKCHIHKFFFKPWDDENLKLEINQALDQYDLIEDNKKLHEEILKQKLELNELNRI